MATSTWTLDVAHSEVSFTVRHMMLTNTRGLFAKFSGDVTLDENDLAKSSVQAEIDASSISTRDEKRDGHLRSPDFLNADKFPKLNFKSTKIEKQGDGLAITGDLTIRDVTKSVVLKTGALSAPLRDPWGGTRRSISGSAKIDRKAFGLVWNAALETGGVLVGDEVSIHIEAELIEKK